MNTPAAGFADLGVPSELCARLERAGITEPFPIQSAVIGDALAGRDLAGRAPTGSGKTLAFGLPLVTRLDRARRRQPTGLILAPTRELANQIATELRPFAKAAGHQVAAIYGGVGYGPQRKALDSGAELLVACPGRLEDLIQSGHVSLERVEQVVIDEADRMADMGFLPAVRRLVGMTAKQRQVLLFSATFDGAVTKLSSDVQRDPVIHEIGDTGPDISTAQHVFWQLDRTERVTATADAVMAMGPTIVFCRTRHGADRLARQLEKVGVTAAPIHGGRSQRQRDRALQAFSNGDVQSLIATDVAARGVHVDGVAGVVHFDPPEDGATYVHRSGRTARAGATGIVVSLVDQGGARAARRMLSEVGIEVAITRVDVAALGAPDAARPQPAPSDRSNSNGSQAAPASAETARSPIASADESGNSRRREGRHGRDGRDGRSSAPRHHPERSAASSPKRSSSRARGTVRFFHSGRGYGFIERGAGGDVFVHHTNIKGASELPKGATVEFAVGAGRKGDEAFDVAVV